jgi:hypothetical protein
MDSHTLEPGTIWWIETGSTPTKQTRTTQEIPDVGPRTPTAQYSQLRRCLSVADPVRACSLRGAEGEGSLAGPVMFDSRSALGMRVRLRLEDSEVSARRNCSWEWHAAMVRNVPL